MIVVPPSIEGAEGVVAEMYDDDLRTEGFVSAPTRMMALNPDAQQAFETLLGTIIPSLGVRTYELATLGAARAMRSPHCLLAHARKALVAGELDEDQLAAFGRGDDSELSDADMAIIRFAERVSTDAGAMTDADSQSLRDHGFTDRQIVDIALAAGVRNFFSRALMALAVPVDTLPGLSPALADVLLTATRDSS